MNEARMSRDSTLQDKAMTLQQQMMPEQLSVQMGAMKPMMFTMVFIIAIFAWLTTTVEDFRVGYISLPWAPEWGLERSLPALPSMDLCLHLHERALGTRGGPPHQAPSATATTPW